jgi:hypothetical protein
MSVIFEATIKMNDNLEWFIEVKDTVDGRIENCSDLDEFSKKVEELGEDYGGHVDEVRWGKDDNVPEQVIDELRVKMAEHRAAIEEQTGSNITPVAVKKDEAED